jgi:hypothetical protein
VIVSKVPFPQREMHNPVALLDYCEGVGLRVPHELRVVASAAPQKLQALGLGFDVAALDKVTAAQGLTLHQRLQLKAALSHAGLLGAGRAVA